MPALDQSIIWKLGLGPCRTSCENKTFYLTNISYSSLAVWNWMVNPILTSTASPLCFRWQMTIATHLEFSSVAFRIILITLTVSPFKLTTTRRSLRLLTLALLICIFCPLNLHFPSRVTCSRRSFGTTLCPQMHFSQMHFAVFSLLRSMISAVWLQLGLLGSTCVSVTISATSMTNKTGYHNTAGPVLDCMYKAKTILSSRAWVLWVIGFWLTHENL